jgi:hypothetical protein
MNRHLTSKLLLAPVVWVLGTLAAAKAQNNELALTLGRIEGADRAANGADIGIGAGTAFQANYGRTLARWNPVSLQVEVHFLANPLREVDSFDRSITKDFASLYVTPGVRLKLIPSSRISPWLSLGAGYALYEHSTARLDGAPNPAPRHLHRGALQFGGGIDVGIANWFGLRAELRDFYTGNPSLNRRPEGSGQHNIVVSGGFLFTF